MEADAIAENDFEVIQKESFIEKSNTKRHKLNTPRKFAQPIEIDDDTSEEVHISTKLQRIKLDAAPRTQAYQISTRDCFERISVPQRPTPPTPPSKRRASTHISIDTSSESESDGSLPYLPNSRNTTPRKPKKPVQLTKIWKRNYGIQQRSLSYGGVEIRVGNVVEFIDGSFMLIKGIEHETDDHGVYVLIGYVYVRVGTVSLTPPAQRHDTQWQAGSHTENKDTKLPLSYLGQKLLNEVVRKVVTYEHESPEDHGLWRRFARDVISSRALIETTEALRAGNCLTSSVSDGHGLTDSEVEETGLITCRWVEEITYNKHGKFSSGSLHRPVTSDILDDTLFIAEQQRELWRGVTRCQKETKSLVFCDAFCGCGGMSLGAKLADLNVKIGFDKDEKKIATHKLNFPNCKSLAFSADEFIEMANDKGWRVSILHLSPPCQPYSPVNTNPNEEKNAINQAALLSCTQIIQVLKPRIVTIEETPGIHVDRRHKRWFQALVNQLTEIGFSVRWKEIVCAEFGVPQLRRRLFLLAAAPGESLPPFPIPTHQYGEITIAHALREVEKQHARRPLSHHDTTNLTRTPKPPYDAAGLAKTITCSGGESYYPNGKRSFTPRELLAIQTFPANYICGKVKDKHGNTVEISKSEFTAQIGNAVPPLVGKAVLEACIRSLAATDEKRQKYQAAQNEKKRKEGFVVDLTED